ncbi:ATP-dependent DNA ligase [Desulfosarcina alkanivorans]|uniref:ATP-dependent DNA ligase n=2 Tax=Desulfosarcina alkanivorans TaxID=571177 RepID=A0A5K7YVI2_9BACT|nr:ATP-dependent DNA ligase [Desulfosarcina alkanivorans]
MAILVGLAGADTRAFELMLPRVYDEGMAVSNWLMSEKLDGVRGYWDGRQLFSKNGTLFHAPPAFTRNFPDFAVEGEIWGGRNTFEKTAGIVRQQEAHDGWLALKFAVFDVPTAGGGFENRLRKAADWFDRHPSDHAFVIEHRPVESHAHVSQELKRIEALGGEGLILRRRGSLYTAGRSRDILKVKSYADMEAVVVAHLSGKGRNEGRMGSLVVELPGSRTRFKIGTGFSDATRENPPPVGTLITFKHYGFYQSGIPKFPSFLRVRDDF